jgi:hypothetical protein
MVLLYFACCTASGRARAPVGTRSPNIRYAAVATTWSLSGCCWPGTQVLTICLQNPYSLSVMVRGLGMLASLILWSPTRSKFVGVSRGCQAFRLGQHPDHLLRSSWRQGR